MILIINGEKKELKDDTTIDEIIHGLNIADKVMAIAVNSQIVKKEQWDKFKPIQNDKLELLNFVGGG